MRAGRAEQAEGSLNSADRVGPWDHGAMGPRGLDGAMRSKRRGRQVVGHEKGSAGSAGWCHRKRRVYVGVGVGLGGWGGRAARAVQAMEGWAELWCVRKGVIGGWESGWGWGGVRADGAMDGVGGQQGQTMQPWGHEPLRP